MKVDLFIKRAAEFMAGFAEGLGVDAEQARKEWQSFAHDLTYSERLEYLGQGRARGLSFGKHAKKISPRGDRAGLGRSHNAPPISSGPNSREQGEPQASEPVQPQG